VKRIRVRRGLVALVAAVAVLAVGGVAYATIPDSSGVIHGCYANKGGSLRVIDTGSGGSCDTKKETALNWNQVGPAGAAGPQGPIGPSGTSHGYYSYTGLLNGTKLGTSFANVEQITGLSAGTYVVWARGLVSDLPNNQEAECKLVAGGIDIEETLVDTYAVGSPRLPFTLSAAVTLTGPGSVETDCDSNDLGGFAFVQDVSMTAIKVDALN
jgi:hypothetical protein